MITVFRRTVTELCESSCIQIQVRVRLTGSDLHCNVMIRSALSRQAATGSMSVVIAERATEHNHFSILCFRIDIDASARAARSLVVVNTALVHQNISVFHKHTAAMNSCGIPGNRSGSVQSYLSARNIDTGSIRCCLVISDHAAGNCHNPIGKINCSAVSSVYALFTLSSGCRTVFNHARTRKFKGSILHVDGSAQNSHAVPDVSAANAYLTLWIIQINSSAIFLHPGCDIFQVLIVYRSASHCKYTLFILGCIFQKELPLNRSSTDMGRGETNPASFLAGTSAYRSGYDLSAGNLHAIGYCIFFASCLCILLLGRNGTRNSAGAVPAADGRADQSASADRNRRVAAASTSCTGTASDFPLGLQCTAGNRDTGVSAISCCFA